MSSASRKLLRGMIRNECERQHYKKAGKQAGANYRNFYSKNSKKGEQKNGEV